MDEESEEQRQGAIEQQEKVAAQRSERRALTVAVCAVITASGSLAAVTLARVLDGAPR